ncbi:type III-B CRISPR module-associated protein Cmr5 [Hydrogenivirga sp.]
MRSREQLRMSEAYKNIMCIKNEDLEGNYLGLVKRLPSMLLQSGLVATLAFLNSKAKDGNEYQMLLEQLSAYIDKSLGLKCVGRTPFSYLKNVSLDEYIYISQELLAFATWLKRIAEGELKDGSGK